MSSFSELSLLSDFTSEEKTIFIPSLTVKSRKVAPSLKKNWKKWQNYTTFRESPFGLVIFRILQMLLASRSGFAATSFVCSPN